MSESFKDWFGEQGIYNLWSNKVAASEKDLIALASESLWNDVEEICMDLDIPKPHISRFKAYLIRRKTNMNIDNRMLSEAKNIEDLPLMTKQDDDGIWILTFRQTADSTNPSLWTKDVIKLNQNDPNNINYSILHQLEQYRNEKDGRFEFKLIWPKSNKLKDQHWKQISNPIDVNSTGNIKGYEAMNINYTDKNWGGLEWTGTHSDRKGNDCLINGSTNSDYYWYYTLGAYRTCPGWNNGIPGPNCIVHQVELWVLSYSFDKNGEAFLRYFLERRLQIPMNECIGWLSYKMNTDIYDTLVCAQHINDLSLS